MYIPPEQTRFSTDEPYTEIENELSQLKEKYSHVMLLGDFNSRVKDRTDFIEIDCFLDKEFSLDELTQETNENYSVFDLPHFSLKRESKDNKMNNFGYRLLDFCKSQNLYILNGRTFLDKLKGDTTCRNASVVDYFVCSLDMFPSICNFYVDEFCHTLSDVHKPVCLSIKSNRRKYECNKNLNPEERVRLWDSRKADQFITNVDCQMHINITDQLTCLTAVQNISESDINEVVENCNKLLINTARDTFGTMKFGNTCIYNQDKPDQWFGPECKRARKNFHSAKYYYRKRKTESNKSILHEKSKAYKKSFK